MNPRRRAALQALAAASMSLWMPARAQVPARVIWLSSTRAADGSPFLDELRRGLRELGYAEGRNLQLDPRWAENSAERVPALVSEAIAARPQVIVVQGPIAVPLRQATATIPIVFAYSGNPVEAKLAESLARPGGNATGVSFLALDMVAKRMELLKEILPGARRIAVLAQPAHPGDQSERKASEAAAAALGLGIEFFTAQSGGLDGALAAIAKSRCDAVLMFPVQSIIINRQKIAEWAISHRLPTISGWAQFAEGGNLMTYGPNLREASRRLASYVDRILKGAKPADLPIELPSRVEMVVNLKTAKALGIKVPQSILLRADALIE